MTRAPTHHAQRIAWIEAIRVLAVVMLLLYHAQLLFTGYAFTPKPTGLEANLQQLATPTPLTEQGWLWWFVSLMSWFGYQFVDVLVLVSGFSLVRSLQGRPLQTGRFLRKRLLRVLLPYWVVAVLAYPILWAIANATNGYMPDLWHIFAGLTFPLLFDFSGDMLLRTNLSWWVVPLILSFTLLFPWLWMLLERWGKANLLWVSLGLTLVYRAIAVYWLDGHPVYVVLDSTAGWQPFALFLAKLSTFVLGMVVGVLAIEQRGPLMWQFRRALLIGLLLYLTGFVAQFYRLGWVIADLLLPIGLTLVCMAVFRPMAHPNWVKQMLVWLGKHSYSYYLVQFFVVDRAIKLIVRDDARLYTLLLPGMIVGTLILAMVVEATYPVLRSFGAGVIRDLDFVLHRSPTASALPSWHPQVGEAVFYRGLSHWKVLKTERLLDEHEMLLCQISDGQRSLWVPEADLEPSETAAAETEANDTTPFSL
ncbi:MAG TPA: acyltransferase [Leptolyngbyaceae cyanobacterium M33_DOE_097]|uniref:Acyltransferase n=1 Tax=Oscillatoriales cyanobacterium SpSt-418 TaxID=2282169 RepID=A0A7C3PT22_9CYAN|nr:acyltransferase [Leptolyngbyaceae cyanobacterium M33_DOE_097]